jgi:hypothetical protein
MRLPSAARVLAIAVPVLAVVVLLRSAVPLGS